MTRRDFTPGPWADNIAHEWCSMRFSGIRDLYFRTRYGITAREALKVFRWCRDFEREGPCPV